MGCIILKEKHLYRPGWRHSSHEQVAVLLLDFCISRYSPATWLDACSSGSVLFNYRQFIDVVITDPSWANAAGLLVMTLNDLARWDMALRSEKVVSRSSYRHMTTAFMTTTNGSANYGLGLFVDSVSGQPRVGHTGGSLGFTTADEFFPRQDVRIIAFTNLHDDTPEEGETLTNILFADLFPEIAMEANKPARGERATVTQTVRDAFRELQAGDNYERFNPHLKDKLGSGIGARYASEFRPYGPSTGEIFKGMRQDAKETWYDYVLKFGPGVFLPFSVKIGEDGAVTSFSVGYHKALCDVSPAR